MAMVFVGSMSQAHDDASGTYGLVLKTDFNGNVTYIKHWGASGNDVEATSVAKLTGALRNWWAAMITPSRFLLT